MRNIFFLFLVIQLFQSCSAEKKLLKERAKLANLDDYNSRISNYQMVAQNIQLNANDSLLDIGSGFGHGLSIMANYLPTTTHFFAEDIIPKFCNKDSYKSIFEYYNSKADIKNFTFKYGTKNHIPFASRTFRNITLCLTIHEFELKQAMLEEIRRVLTYDGSLHILETVNTIKTNQKENCGFEYLTNNEFMELIQQANFSIIKDSTLKRNQTDTAVMRYLICKRQL